MPGSKKQHDQRDGDPLERKHRQDLEKSGLSAEMIAAMGCFSADRDQIRRFTGVKVMSGGYGIPYLGAEDQTGAQYCRFRLSKPKDGMKYVSGKGDEPELYLPPGFNDLPAGQILVVTEGEKKAARAVQEGIACVGLQGVSSWADRASRAVEKADDIGVSADTAPLARLLQLTGRYPRVLIFGDYDVLTNHSSRSSLRALEQSLLKRNIHTSLAYCPPAAATGPDAPPSKQGLDDWMVQGKPGFVRHALETNVFRSFDRA